ncbi:tetraspanin Pls1 family [Mycena rebaudengoi]|nr:tetraspanin Pls1 family [Mycena rebaudengoi]
MVSKKLMGCWAFIDFLLLVAAGLSIAFSILWRAPNLLMNMAISNDFLTAGMVLGIALALTFVISLGAVVQRNHVTIGFVILNWFLVVDAVIITVVGSMIWFLSLQQRDKFHTKWIALRPQDRITLQDQFKCCGYFNKTDTFEIGGTFCTSPEFVAGLDANVTTNFCVTPVTAFTDYALENTFTFTGYMAVTLSLLVASMCVIKKRQEEERFKKIDAKRGGRGFV